MNRNERPAVALFGASVRALARSAANAGFDVFACDLFRDDDLVECCRESVRLERGDYPEGFRLIADRWPGIPRVYTGGLENFPEVVEALAKSGPLWGCPPDSLQACRSPTALRECGIKTPEVITRADGVPTDGSWLLKPLRGSAGRGIRPWRGGELPADCFLQERVSGEPCSASFLAHGNGTLLYGASIQFIGEPWTGASPFAYSGGIAPLELSTREKDQLDQVGEKLRRRFGLVGLLGVDAVRNGDDWTIVEINPRPTSSMELLELSGLASLFELHHSAFGGPGTAPVCSSGVAGKAILYATERTHLIESPPTIEGDVFFADRPAPGTAFDVGDPVATVLAVGDSIKEVTPKLERGIRRLTRRLARINDR